MSECLFPCLGQGLNKSSSKVSEYLGVGAEFLPSDVPTLRSALRKILLHQERNAEDKRNIPIFPLMTQVVDEVVSQWRKSNSKLSSSVGREWFQSLIQPGRRLG